MTVTVNLKLLFAVVVVVGVVEVSDYLEVNGEHSCGTLTLKLRFSHLASSDKVGAEKTRDGLLLWQTF